ncbi:hypothetical protein RhiirB3_531541 [Rhizophagus irregularis]|nr:hypothetical protein RhiirB3_531541 [Rhizophagus irregularis]
MNNNIEYDTFVCNLPNPIDYNDIFNDSLSDMLFSFSSLTSPIPNSFNISSFNINGLKTPGQDYSSFHSDLDSTKHGRSSGGVSLFIHNSLATHVQFYEFHSSHILSVDLYFKGNVKLRIFVVYIPPTNDPILGNAVIDQLISLLSLAASQNFHHAIIAICGIGLSNDLWHKIGKYAGELLKNFGYNDTKKIIANMANFKCEEGIYKLEYCDKYHSPRTW